VFKESVHHLYKIVNQKPLVRPPWYFDTDVQGEGIVDVSTHLVDMTHWMLFPGQAINYTEDIQLMEAHRWSTLIPRDRFSKITGLDRFPDSIQDRVTGNGLEYFCNGELSYRIKKIPVKIRVIWNLEIPEGGGDKHFSLIKGTRSNLQIRQLPQHGFKVELLILPRENPTGVAAAVQQCLDKWSQKYPGLWLTREDENILVNIPDKLRTTHEEHFCEVRDMYLACLKQENFPEEAADCIVSKYTLLAEARKMALISTFRPSKDF
jgi:hypothetical protein